MKGPQEKGRCAVIVFILSLFSFWMYNLSRSFFFTSEALYYTVTALSTLASALIPVFIGCILFFRHKTESRGKLFLSAVILNLPRFIYLVPYYYLYYMDMGFDTSESLVLLSIHSAVIFLLFVIETYLYAFFAEMIFKGRANKNHRAENLFEDSGVFETSVPVTYAYFFISLMKFIVNIVNELKNAIEYFIEYKDDYRPDDISYMLGSFIFILVIMIISHLIMHYTKKVFFVKVPRAEEKT